ncbi:aminotransferase class I/II-fold pyridoxal phosphate-dependent enzyme [Kitasatospora sp. GP82]|uniref:aminotransferase class I/II-fold pyridoxal phosphate-dependent enzyme n=1 Tax=Kitasatospora sp. GP82 TaxID=3035089 RepID=UPI002475B101|nr:aminotransferase class I/II-fold pyridoxal phosphate-dependent enzyme [Kitasatospora sp. GP82]MDH6126536.1 biotin operon repressor [Kitasatospora sp. GP82]
MPLEWSGLSPELLLVIDRDSGEPLRSQLERRVRDAIRTGRMQAGERLPSSRELARMLGLSRGLVQDCYAQLQAEGYLVARVGSVTRVAAGAGVPPAPAPSLRPGVPPSPPEAHRRLVADFRWGVPDLSSFPLTDWLWAMREAARTMPASALDYGDPRGSAELREVVAGYLRRVRAAEADPERIVICSGYAQGLGLALRALEDVAAAPGPLEVRGRGGLGRRVRSRTSVPGDGPRRGAAGQIRMTTAISATRVITVVAVITADRAGAKTPASSCSPMDL